MKKKRTRGEKKRHHLAMLYREDIHCRMCQRETVLTIHPLHKAAAPNTAVLVRWFPNDDPRYWSLYDHKKRRLVCLACANRRHQEFEANRPLEELWARSGRFGGLYAVEGEAA